MRKRIDIIVMKTYLCNMQNLFVGTAFILINGNIRHVR